MSNPLLAVVMLLVLVVGVTLGVLLRRKFNPDRKQMQRIQDRLDAKTGNPN